MRPVFHEPHFDAWRSVARRLLAERIPPEEVLWSDTAEEPSLFADGGAGGSPGPVPRVPSAFPGMAMSAAAHTDPQRWGVLYRLLWRLTHGGEPRLLSVPTDPVVRQVQRWCKAVGRDLHKMHAFVRFRLTGTCEGSGREQFVAWFEPEYAIVRLAAPFFCKRFAGMDWSILTPRECAHWNGEELYFTAGVPRSAAPDEDALDTLWRAYYRSIFNPARVKVKAMQSEMPKKYWKNLPEAGIIGGLIAGSTDRVQEMLHAEERPPKPAPGNLYLAGLRELNGGGDGET